MDPQTARNLLDKHYSGAHTLPPEQISFLESIAAQSTALPGTGGTSSLGVKPINTGGTGPEIVPPPIQKPANTGSSPSLSQAYNFTSAPGYRQAPIADVVKGGTNAAHTFFHPEEQTQAYKDSLPEPVTGTRTTEQEPEDIKPETPKAVATGSTVPYHNPLVDIENQHYAALYGTPGKEEIPSIPKYSPAQKAQVDVLNKQLAGFDDTLKKIQDSGMNDETKQNLFFETTGRKQKVEEQKAAIDAAAAKNGMTTAVAGQAATPGVFGKIEEGTKTSNKLNESQSEQILNEKINQDKLITANEEGIAAKKAEESRQKAAYVDDLYKAADELKNYKEDPNRAWNSRSSGQKAMGIIGIILGGFDSKHGNMAMNVLNKETDDDIAAQRAGYEAKKASFNAKNSLYGKMMDKYHDPIAAQEAAKVVLIDQSARRIENITATTNNERVKQNGEAALLELEKNKANAAQQHALALLSANTPKGTAQTKISENQQKILGDYNEAAQSIKELEDNYRSAGGGNPYDINKKNVGSRVVAGVKDFVAGEGTNFQGLPQTVQDRANNFDTAKQYWTGKASVMTGQGSVSQPELVRSRFGNARNEKELADAVRFLQTQIVAKGQAFDKKPNVPIVTAPPVAPLNPNRAK